MAKGITFAKYYFLKVLGDDSLDDTNANKTIVHGVFSIELFLLLFFVIALIAPVLAFFSCCTCGLGSIAELFFSRLKHLENGIWGVSRERF